MTCVVRGGGDLDATLPKHALSSAMAGWPRSSASASRLCCPAGFRRYDRIRETLLHELAHMVHSEHDDAFKELNSQVSRACGECRHLMQGFSTRRSVCPYRCSLFLHAPGAKKATSCCGRSSANDLPLAAAYWLPRP